MPVRLRVQSMPMVRLRLIRASSCSCVWVLYLYLFTDTPDDQTGGESSKSNSITSEHSVQSIGVSASSQSSSTNSLPPAVDNSNNIENSYSNITINRSRPRVRRLVLFICGFCRTYLYKTYFCSSNRWVWRWANTVV